MSADSAVTYTSVHSEARSWSIPSEDPYEEAARQLLEQAPRSPEYVPNPMELEDHVPVYILEPKHPEDLVPVEDEAPTPLLPPSFLSPRIRPLSPRALAAGMRDVASSLHHSLHLSGTPSLLPIPPPAPSASRRAEIPKADTPPRKRLLLTTPRPSREVGESSAAAAARQPGQTMAHGVDLQFCRHYGDQKDRAAVRAEIEVLRRERLAYEQESMETRQALARSEAYCRALEAWVTVLETEVHRHEWQHQAADDLAVQHIIYEAQLSLELTKELLCCNWLRQKASRVTEMALTTMVLRELSDSLDGLRKWSPCLALAIAQQLVKSNSRLALCKTMLLHVLLAQRGEIKKIESEMWNLKSRDQCGVANSVKASKPKTSHEAIRVQQTELMDKRPMPSWNVRQKGKESMMIFPRTIKTNNSKIRGRTQARPTLQAIVTGNHTPGLNLCVPSVITIMKVLVHLGAITARGLAI
ncbi:hypothetical protein Tco_0149679 [Tanacetum coccineum]